MERFQLGLMLSVIAVRNMVEMAGSDFAFLPKSFIRGKSLIDTIWSVSGKSDKQRSTCSTYLLTAGSRRHLFGDGS